jgi:mRNA interferase RelE/StbE
VAYAIDVLRAADKFLEKLEQAQPTDAEAIDDVIEALSEDPRPPGCTRLRGYTNIWRVRVGNYRICYQIDDGTLVVLVVTISTRDDVYKLVRRHMGR